MVPTELLLFPGPNEVAREILRKTVPGIRKESKTTRSQFCHLLAQTLAALLDSERRELSQAELDAIDENVDSLLCQWGMDADEINQLLELLRPMSEVVLPWFFTWLQIFLPSEPVQ